MNVWVVPADMRALYQAQMTIAALSEIADRWAVVSAQFAKTEPPVGKQH
jgi:hypothetical protein